MISIKLIKVASRLRGSGTDRSLPLRQMYEEWRSANWFLPDAKQIVPVCEEARNEKKAQVEVIFCDSFFSGWQSKNLKEDRSVLRSPEVVP